VEEIEAVNEAQPLQLRPGAVDGRFEGMLNTTNYLDDDACSTLGTLTFQQFGPNDLRARRARARPAADARRAASPGLPGVPWARARRWRPAQTGSAPLSRAAAGAGARVQHGGADRRGHARAVLHQGLL